jgi:hypothetical protein
MGNAWSVHNFINRVNENNGFLRASLNVKPLHVVHKILNYIGLAIFSTFHLLSFVLPIVIVVVSNIVSLPFELIKNARQRKKNKDAESKMQISGYWEAKDKLSSVQGVSDSTEEQ